MVAASKPYKKLYQKLFQKTEPFFSKSLPYWDNVKNVEADNAHQKWNGMKRFVISCLGINNMDPADEKLKITEMTRDMWSEEDINSNQWPSMLTKEEVDHFTLLFFSFVRAILIV